MQLTKRVLVVPLLLAVSATYAQTDSMSDTIPDKQRAPKDDIIVNFISSYYQQDGQHSAVTGGAGTEELTNIAPSININIPFDPSSVLNINGGVDFYSSASTDNIDNPYLQPDYFSGPSAHDARAYGTLKYDKKYGTKRAGVLAGLSSEFDVNSYHGGLSFGLSSNDNNRGLEISASYYYDDWRLIYPSELRTGTEAYLPTDVRQTGLLSAVFSANLTRRLAASIATDIVVQEGMLSTPFHRVYFSDATMAVVEQLPGNRLKYPIGLRLNYHLTDIIILRCFYRYYADDWGLTASTFELMVPLKLSQAFRLYPFYRFTAQNEARYFAPYKEHNSSEEFFTSDHDLSTFNANKFGLEMVWSPLFGVLGQNNGKDRTLNIKGMALRFAKYIRSDGLEAEMVTFGLEMNLKQWWSSH